MRQLVWGAVLSAVVTVPAPGQRTRVDLVRQSDIIFTGTVLQAGAVASADVPVSPLMLVVRIDQVLEKPDAVGLAAGDSVTVEQALPGGLKAGTQATFYTTGWIFGRLVAVHEVGHELARSGMGLSPAGPPGGPAGQVPQDSIMQARRQGNDAELRARARSAAMVVVGRVAEVRRAAFTAAPNQPRRITEHDPDWQEAVIEVQDAIKGATVGQRVVVRFPGSDDVAWVGTPRFAVGQEGTFLLDKDTASGSPMTMVGNQSVSTYTALESSHVLQKGDAQRVRALLKPR